MSEQRSEIARLKWRIEQECEAIHRVMQDPGFSASHSTIERRYQALDNYMQNLAGYIGSEQAVAQVYNTYTATLEAS